MTTRSWVPELDSLAEGRGSRQGQCLVLPGLSSSLPPGALGRLSLSASFREWLLGEGWWNIKAVLEPEKPTLNQAEKDRSLKLWCALDNT